MKATTQLQDPYAVLGLEPGASRLEVDAAHRRLAHEWDVVRFGSANEAEIASADERVAELDRAYTAIRVLLIGTEPAPAPPPRAVRRTRWSLAFVPAKG